MPVSSQLSTALESTRQHCHNLFGKLNTMFEEKAEAAGVKPKAGLYAILVFLTTLYLVQKLIYCVQVKRTQRARPSTPTNLEKRGSGFKAPERKFGGNSFHNTPSRDTPLTTQFTQYGTPCPLRAPAHHLTPTGISTLPNHSPTAPFATAPNTTSPWVSAPCTGTSGSSSTTSI